MGSKDADIVAIYESGAHSADIACTDTKSVSVYGSYIVAACTGEVMVIEKVNSIWTKRFDITVDCNNAQIYNNRIAVGTGGE